MYFDYQVGHECHYCLLDTGCGYFKCSIEQVWGVDVCGDAYDAEGGDQCFTLYGLDHGCKPDLQMVQASPQAAAGWRLVRVRVERRGLRRQKG